MKVGDLVRNYPGLLSEKADDELGIVVGIDDDGVILVKWPERPVEYEIEFALEVVNEHC